MRNGGAVPDPSAQFSQFRLYIFEHPAFHSAQDDEMLRRVSIGRCPKVSRKSLDIRFPVLDFPNIAHLTANTKDFSTSLEMTVRESH